MAQRNETLEAYVIRINQALEVYLTSDLREADSEGATVMREAMRYSLENGGKRVRPVLVLAFCEACGGTAETALPFACALELLHSYSLIHDDLPCMDDAATRRGKPASHIRFGEARALLAGDALLALAFEVLLSAEGLPAERLAEAGRVLARAAGYAGMVAGQTMDLSNEKRQIDAALLRQTDALKTGALIAAACELGCIAAGADASQRGAALEYARGIGLAFQIKDDILDVTGGEALGKPLGGDEKNEKSTYVSLLGMEESLAQVKRLSARAKDALRGFEGKQTFLLDLADQLADREK